MIDEGRSGPDILLKTLNQTTYTEDMDTAT